MLSITRLARLTAAATATVGLALTGTGAANAADVSLPVVENNTVSVRVDNPLPGKLGLPPVLGQSCTGVMVPPHALPEVLAELAPLADGGLVEIIAALGTLRGDVTILGPTLPGIAGTITATNVRDDFYIQPVICLGGRDGQENAAPELNLFLTQVGNPLGAFEGSVAGSLGGSASAEGSSIGLGSAELGVGSQDGLVDLGSTSGVGPGSAVDVGFQGSIADVTTGSTGVDLGAGSTGSEAGIDLGRGSVETSSVGTLDTASLTSSLDWPAGSSNGSSIDVGSAVPVGSSIISSVEDLPGSQVPTSAG